MSILLAAFGAIGGDRISLSGLTISAIGSGGAQTATYTLESDGDVMSATTDGGSVDAGDWIDPKANAPSDYEVQATLVSGTLSTGTTGSWLALSSNRSWTLQRVTVGAATQVTLTIEIRKGSGAVLASATVTLDAERTS